MITITQQDFEKYVYSAASCDSTIFNAVSPYLERAYNDIRYTFDSLTDTQVAGHSELLDYIKRFTCNLGFQKALRHLDLVLTDAGFGVVSNQNTAPASAERVNNLEKALLKEVDKSKCDIYRYLIEHTTWGTTSKAKATIVRILWDRQEAAELCGVADPEHAEWVTLQRSIFDAEYELSFSISADVMYDIRKKMLENNLTDIEKTAMEKIRHAASTLVVSKDNLMMHKAVKRDLIDWFDDHKASFTVYTNSKEYKARHEERFKNTEDSAAYWF